MYRHNRPALSSTSGKYKNKRHIGGIESELIFFFTSSLANSRKMMYK